MLVSFFDHSVSLKFNLSIILLNGLSSKIFEIFFIFLIFFLISELTKNDASISS